MVECDAASTEADMIFVCVIREDYDFRINHLQFSDDTLVLSEKTWNKI